MDIVAVEVEPSSANAESDQKQQTQVKKPRRRITAAAQAQNVRVCIPSACTYGIYRLKEELGLRSLSETIHWLLHEVRPELVPEGKPRATSSRPNSSVPRPVCMAYANDDIPVSHLTVGSGCTLVPKQPVRATVVQASSVFFDTPATLEKAERLVMGAAAYGSQIVVFPEAFVGGYPRFLTLKAVKATIEEEDDLQRYYASAIDVPGPEVDRLAKLAQRCRVYLIMGVVERAGFYLYSTVLFFSPQGQHLGQQRKLKPMTSESALWYSGEKSPLSTYETPFGKFGGLISWDNKSPFLRTELYGKGIQIYCAPTADDTDVWKASMIHVAVEGGCFVLSANQFCQRKDYPVLPEDSSSSISLDKITCAGGSLIVSPSGTILAGPNYVGECLISADLDLGEITQTRRQFFGIGNNVGVEHVNAEIGPKSICM